MVAVIERVGTSKESWCPRKGQAAIDLSCIMERKQGLVARQQSTPYQKQKSALEMEFKRFLESTSQRDMCTAVPDDVVDLLICKTAH